MPIRVVKMPDIGEGIAEVELVAWHVKQGDVVAEDQALADVMTDKANVEIPAPVAGTIIALGGEIGQTMAVGSELVRIAVGEDARAEAESAAAAAMPQSHAAAAETSRWQAAAAATQPQAAALRATPQIPATPPRPSPAAPEPAASLRAAAPAERPFASPSERPIASPSVRRRAWDLDVDLADVHGTGSGGRIMHGDLDAYVAQRGAAGRAAPHVLASLRGAAAGTVAVVPRPPAAAVTQSPAAAGTSEVEAIRVVGLRRQIAQKMQESKRRIPHFTYVEEIDVTRLEELRREVNDHYGASRAKLSPLSFVMRAMVVAVQEFPQVNARFDDEAGVVTRYAAVHIGIATDTPNGLLVPVVRDAQTLDVWQCAAAVTRVADIARSGHATRDQLTGSTITITSLGALGGIVSTPVINHPEVAIVGVNRIVERPAIVDGAVVARKLMNLSSSFDHRVVDGADAARFIQAVRGYLESPAPLLVVDQGSSTSG